MRRLNLLAKGNLDVRDSLHSLSLGGRLVWNGINQIVRPRFPEIVVRVRHEPLSRSDALLAATGSVPSEIAARKLPLAPFSAQSQFSAAAYDGGFDAIVLSVQADVMARLLRHREEGYLFLPYNMPAWPEVDANWVRQSFVHLDLLEVSASMAALEHIIARIRLRAPVPILIYNLSPVSPGDTIHCHQGFEDLFSTRVRRFNLALVELSCRTGISIVDVETVVARAGADRVKADPLHLTPEGNRLVAEEVVRILEDLGCFAAA